MTALALIETELLEDSEAALAAEDDAGAGRAAAASLAASNALRIPELLKQLSSVLGSAGEMHRRSEEKTAKVRPQLGKILWGGTAALLLSTAADPVLQIAEMTLVEDESAQVVMALLAVIRRTEASPE